jgi:predicted DNA-binding protein (MmcQ/YjbR family)
VKRVTTRAPTSPLRVLARVRRFMRKLAGVEERLSRGTPVFGVGDPQFAMVVDDHHGAECAGVWAKCADGLQAYRVRSDAKRYFVPPYLGSRGWIGIRIDARADWKAIEALLQDAHAITARGRR